VGRLKREVTLEAAASELRTVASRLERQYPETNRRWSAAVRSLREDLAAETAPLANLLFGAVAFVLAIACANLGHLLLVKAASRERELAVRAALGASRLQLARQLVIEGLLLSLAGGSLGLLLAFWSHQLIPALSDAELPGWLEFLRLDWRVLAFCLLVSVGSGVLFGLIPALPFSRPDLARSLKEGPAASTTVRGARLRSLFVVGQMAVAMLLLAGAGLLIKSLWRASQVDLGYETAHLLRAEIPLLGERAADERRTEAFARQLRLRLGTLPATGVALSRSVFFAGLGGRPQKITAEDRPEVPAGASPHFYEAVTPGYFRTLGVRVLEGREFSDSDRSGGAPVVIVNDELARQIWPGESALGKQLKLGARESQTPWRTIVGVVASSGRSSPGTARPSLAYVPLWQEARGSLTLLIRTPGDPMALANGVRAAVAALDPDQPLENLTSLEAWLGRLLAPWRFMAILMTVLAGGAVLLATIGIYGVISYAAVQRRQEIGIRIALGATSADIRRLVLKSGLRLATSGVAFGLAGAAALTRLLRAVLVGTSPLDPLVFATMAAVLMGIALAAAYFPARGAARIDPVAALRL
jgi:putative ABC transport system permease protein